MELQPLTLDTTITRSSSLLSSNLAGDVVMMDIEQGSYYGLETVAARIWTLTEQPITISALCENLVSEYNIAPEQCQQEVMTFLSELLVRRIIQIVT